MICFLATQEDGGKELFSFPPTHFRCVFPIAFSLHALKQHVGHLFLMKGGARQNLLTNKLSYRIVLSSINIDDVFFLYPVSPTYKGGVF